MWGWINWLRFKKQAMFGIDVSHWQGSIDWHLVKSNQEKVSFAFIKATEGTTYVDPLFKLNAFSADKAGIRISYYHFATLNTDNVIADSEAEAKFFLSTISKAPANKLPLALDIEQNKAVLSKQDVLLWINHFFDVLADNGHPDSVLYSYTPFLNDNLPANHNLGNKKLWIAHYTSAPGPKLPVGWSEYWLWQNSAKGKVLGIKGEVDTNKSKWNV